MINCIVLLSNWSSTVSYTTQKDTTVPIEIQNVSAERKKISGVKKGEVIKLTWDKPVGAVIKEQIEYYRIYKKSGTESHSIIQ